MSNEETKSQENDLPESWRMANELREDIGNGRFRPGEKLPSQRELATRYGVVRSTAAKAVKILEAEGLIDTLSKSGSRVRTKQRLFRLGSERYSNKLREQTGLSPFRAEVEKQGKTPSTKCTSITKEAPPSEIAERLRISTEEPVVRRENWYFADDVPVQVGVTFIPVQVAEDSPLEDSTNLGKGSLYGRFEDKGYVITWIREEISSRMPTADETKRLEVPAGVPIIEVVHTGLDQEKEPFEVTVFRMRSDLNGLDYEIKVN
ncbi:GntR family transcriptional regulator [Haloglycomyces albus]|uniref:GntR family transcriptional regulator n=1 Tax=Haloglycomyces albus TaxID=526067 RepID=UPI00046D652C|nr:GntR family transcriptional regulator [Haloglycomyces albus]